MTTGPQCGILPDTIHEMPVRPVSAGAALALAEAITGRAAFTLDAADSCPHRRIARGGNVQARAKQQIVAVDLGSVKVYAAGDGRTITQLHHQARLIGRLGLPDCQTRPDEQHAGQEHGHQYHMGSRFSHLPLHWPGSGDISECGAEGGIPLPFAPHLEAGPLEPGLSLLRPKSHRQIAPVAIETPNRSWSVRLVHQRRDRLLGGVQG